MAGKPFSKRLYENDDNAKDQFVEYLRENNYEAWINPDRYGIDVLAHKDGIDYMYEVEVKHNWKGPDFQYDTLHYSDRKRKFLDTPDNTAFVTFNDDRTHVLLVRGPVLAAAPTIVKNTIYTKDEKFIEVKVVDCELISMEDIKWP